MSQFNIRSLREIPNDPNGKFVNKLAKRLSTFLNKEQTDKLEGKEDIYSAAQDTESVIKFHSDLSSTKVFDFQTSYYPPTEPDLDTVKLWLKGYNMGNSLKDWSGFNNENTINGDPVLIDGTPFDYGIHTGGTRSICLRFNRPTSALQNQEYIRINETAGIKMLVSASSISIFIRFRVKSIAQQNGRSITLMSKLDDDVPNYAQMLHITDTGRLRWIIKRGGSVVAAKETATSTIAVDTVYDVWLTYAVSGDAVKIYVNNSDKSLTNYGGSVNWQSTTTDHDMSLFRRGQGTNAGYVYGDLYDYMFLRNKTVSATEVSRHYTNKWTIADIPFGQVMVSDYWATYDPSALGSFGQSYTSTSYTSTSYTV